ncbi:hypothetical protein HKX48_003538 [Thoreauomyces humboldtii]|nr:hypothetical protein HKX48_003538 [Thoreauomyces humboldtii]
MAHSEKISYKAREEAEQLEEEIATLQARKAALDLQTYNVCRKMARLTSEVEECEAVSRRVRARAESAERHLAEVEEEKERVLILEEEAAERNLLKDNVSRCPKCAVFIGK